jgi:hypothetical protein
MPNQVKQNITTQVQQANTPSVQQPQAQTLPPITVDTAPADIQPKEVEFMKQAKAQ